MKYLTQKTKYKGKGNPNHKDNRSLKIYYCKEEECNNKISYQTVYFGQGRCRSCTSKNHIRNPRVKYYCKELNCNNEITYCARHYGLKRCRSCSKIGERNTFYNKKHSKKTMAQMKISQQKRFAIKENHPFYGKHVTEEAKKKISNTLKGQIISKERRKKLSLAAGGTGIPYENSEYGAEFNSQLKLKIRERDNYICQKCNITEEEHIIVYGKILGIHHIDYDKENCEENNLITLCNECNIRVNHNRKYWQNHFKKILIATDETE